MRKNIWIKKWKANLYIVIHTYCVMLISSRYHSIRGSGFPLADKHEMLVTWSAIGDSVKFYSKKNTEYIDVKKTW